MQPRVTKLDRKLHLSYELPHRVYAAQVYSIAAPNSSTVIIYGHSNGLRVLWRGGRRRKGPAMPRAAALRTNEADQDIIEILDEEDEIPQPQQNQDEYETEEEEIDSDRPYPSVIQDLDIEIGSDIVHVAVPTVPSSLAPKILRTTAVVAISSADGAVRILQIPLMVPTEDNKERTIEKIIRSQIELSPKGPIPAGFTMKYWPVDNQPVNGPKHSQSNYEGHLLVASASRALNIWSIAVAADEVVAGQERLVQNVALESAAIHLAFHPSARSAQILLTDISGSVRVHDPFTYAVPQRESIDPTLPNHSAVAGKWVMSYQTPFVLTGDATDGLHFSRRKKILDAKWVLAGKAILTVLEDGQWGVWTLLDLARKGKSVESFAIDGFLDSAGPNEPIEPTKPRKGMSKLAPMTPNTRRSKAEELFKRASRAPGAAPLGGISVTSSNSRTGQTDESVAIWYNSDIYSIPSMQSFWQRSMTNSGGLGSLYSPGLSRITDINLVNENISSILHFSSKPASSGIGQMNGQRDLLVSAEYRVVILQSLRPSTPSRTLFQLAERPSRDVEMLDAGDRDLDNINSILDTMGNNNAPSRRVDFVQ